MKTQSGKELSMIENRMQKHGWANPPCRRGDRPRIEHHPEIDSGILSTIGGQFGKLQIKPPAASGLQKDFIVAIVELVPAAVALVSGLIELSKSTTKPMEN
jgi:hypothetical protein